jgi:ABC-type transport system substrate-binding protein
MRLRLLMLATVAALALAASAPTPAPARSSGGESAAAPVPVPDQSRTLVMVTRFEAELLAPKVSYRGNPATTDLHRLFNASWFGFDERSVPYPYLVEALPQLNTDSWRVLPDGRMEMTYRLRPSLTWHDGTPHTADDYVFAWQVYTTPSLTTFRPLPQRFMAEMIAVDPRTVLVRWNAPYAEAASMSVSDSPPLPRHVLEEPFQQLGRAGGQRAVRGAADRAVREVGEDPARAARGFGPARDAELDLSGGRHGRAGAHTHVHRIRGVLGCELLQGVRDVRALTFKVWPCWPQSPTP